MRQPHRSNHLVLLIAAPRPGETAMRRDQAAMDEALLACDLSADQILSLHDPLDRLRALQPRYLPHLRLLGDGGQPTPGR